MGASAPGQGTVAGDALLAHELAHTAQQRDASMSPSARKKPIGGEEQGAERDADRAALGSLAGRVSDVMKTGLQLQRCAKADPGIDRFTYSKQYEAQISADAANTLRKLPFGTVEGSVSWADGGQQKFAGALADQIAAPSTPEGLESLVRPEKLSSLMDNARMMNEQGSALGPDQYFSAVGVEVANAIARRAIESLQRELPRYAQAKLAGGGEPKAEDIPVSHPIDPLIVKALISGPLVKIDQEKFQSLHPDMKGAPTKQNRTRNIVTEKVGESGSWYRLKEPMDASIEEIATALLGKPTEAFRLTNAHPLYGVRREPKDGESYGDPTSLDPAAQLLSSEPALQEEAILSQAGPAKPTRSADRILEQMRTNSTLLGKSVYEHAIKFGPDVAGRLQPAAQRIDDRIAKLSGAKEADILKWDVQVSKQQDVISKGARGLQADLLRLQMYAASGDTQNRPVRDT